MARSGENGEAVRARGSHPTTSYLGLLLVAPSAIWLTIFVVAPLVLLILMSFWTSGIFGLSTELTLDNYRILFGGSVYALVLLQTLRIAVVVTFLTLLISYPAAYFIA